MIEISLYERGMRDEWDTFCSSAKNGTMLHRRGYMDYHSDRYSDYSLVARDDGGKIVAVLPACRQNETVTSHGGLTYGGWVMPLRHFDATTMLAVMDNAVDFLRRQGVKKLIYKPVPHIYHSYPAEEDLYALFRHGARPAGCNVSTVIDLSRALPPDRGCKSGISHALRSGIETKVPTDFDGEIDQFWAMLTELLESRYGTRPVHTIDEIKLLHSRFPGEIKLVTAHESGEPVAGAVLYVTAGVAHCQYIASTARGRDNRALTLLLHKAVEWAREQGLRYFDFGTSNEDGGRVLNEGLLQQKARLGGRAIAYPTFSIII